MVNKKVLLVGIGLASTTLMGCNNPFKQDVCLYGCPPSMEYTENISEETSEDVPGSEDVTEEIEIDGPAYETDYNIELYGCPMSNLTKKNISEAEAFSEDDTFITIK